ncbi:MAG TPA: YARHG domain-containing protein [Bacteroidia bacterium]|nr:YARHG domain-containing protein [Bacteroidia bacterium]
MKIRITALIFLLFYIISCDRNEKTKTNNIQVYNQDLNNKTLDELKLIRNEIYARKGYVFKNTKLKKYFALKKWYKPNINAKIVLTEIEKNNIELIKKIEFSKKTIINNKKYIDTVYIDYKKNKTILDILASYPKTNMGSWDWSKKERVEMVEFIKKNNFIIDTTEMYLNIEYVKSNTFGTTVVDGFWTFSIFEINNFEHLVIIDDIVGDGNSISTYFFKNNTFTEVNSTEILGDYYNQLLINYSDDCRSFLDENINTFDYDFSNKNIFTISSWHINQKDGKDCFKGNTIEYEWNNQTKSFTIGKIYWKNNK